MDTKVKTDIENLRINGDRLWASLMELAQIGATPKGGVCRLTLTDLDKQGRDLVTRWGREAGMTVTIDKIGNGFMRRPGRNNSLPPIMTGSHIDTQRLALIDRRTGKMTVATQRWDRSIHPPLLWNGDSTAVHFVAEEEARQDVRVSFTTPAANA